jgi:hypothetical protein
MAGLKKVVMLTKGPNRNYVRGAVYEVDEARAACLVAGKHASYQNEGERAERLPEAAAPSADEEVG